MAILCGLMFGALVKLWPFQHDLTPEIEKFKHKEFALYFPNRFDSEVALVVLTMVASALLVLAADFLVKRRGKKAGT